MQDNWPLNGSSSAALQAPFLIRLSCISLFSTGPKIDNFSAKKCLLAQALLPLSKILIALLVAFTTVADFSSECMGRRRNELRNAAGLISLVKKRVYGPRKDIFFYLYSDAQYSLKFPARVVLTSLFLPIYVIMTSFPQKLANFFSFVDFYFIHSHFSYGWT